MRAKGEIRPRVTRAGLRAASPCVNCVRCALNRLTKCVAQRAESFAQVRRMTAANCRRQQGDTARCGSKQSPSTTTPQACASGVDSVDIIGIEPTPLDCGQQWSPLAVAGSALHRVQHVVHRDGVLVLRAEQNDLGVFDRPHAVSGRPVEEVVLFADVDLAIGVSHHDFP